MFLKYKQEASGFPDDVITDSQKEEYVQNYFTIKYKLQFRPKIGHEIDALF